MLFTSDINTQFTSFGSFENPGRGKTDWTRKFHSLGTMGLSRALLDESLAAISLKWGDGLDSQDQGDLSVSWPCPQTPGSQMP